MAILTDDLHGPCVDTWRTGDSVHDVTLRVPAVRAVDCAPLLSELKSAVGFRTTAGLCDRARLCILLWP